MRRWLVSVALCALGAACAPAPPAAPRKLVMIGFDGLDPELTSRFIGEGTLPAMASLAKDGAFIPLDTPATETASAWASLATGTLPATHRVFDSVGRDPITYRPRQTLFTKTDSPAWQSAWGLGAPSYRTARRATPFWVTAGAAGVRTTVIGVPGTFPPDELPNGELLSGYPLPDLQGDPGAYGYLASDLETSSPARSPMGGRLERLALERGIAHTTLPGLDAGRTWPLTITWNREARTVNLDIDGRTVHLSERQWSRWIDLETSRRWPGGPQGAVRFYLSAAGTRLQVVVSPVHWHPGAPPAAISSPPSLAADLFGRLGFFRTLGWPSMAFALADGRIDDEAFLDDVDQAFDDRTETVLNRLDTHNWDLLIGVIDATDQVQHLMWRHIDSGHPAYDAALAPRFGTAIEHVYKRADDFVAAVRARLPADTALVVLSAYGFHTYRASVHLNAFLADRGYLAATSPPAAPRTWHDFFTTDSLGSSVDWPRTRAYALGFGQIYVNLRGREGQGVVAPGAERTALIEQLRTELLALRDPTTGRPVVQQVDVLPEGAADAPDLQVGFAPGYRASWPTVFGDAPTRVVVPNLSRWSGDHASMAAAGVPGVWLSSVKLPQDAGGVLDVAPSVLAYFGVPAAAGSSARRLF